jgi:hypothetical protein
VLVVASSVSSVTDVFVERDEARLIGLDEVTQSGDAASLSVELAFLQSVYRDEDERSDHQSFLYSHRSGLKARRRGEPLTAEADNPLSVGLVGAAVAREKVERPRVVSDLLAAVRATDDRELTCDGRPASNAGSKIRRPRSKTGSSADDFAAFLRQELIEGVTPPIGEYRA